MLRYCLIGWSLLAVAHSASGKDGFAGRFALSSKGIEKILRFGLHVGVPKAQMAMQHFRVPQKLLQPIHPDVERCRPDQVKRMWAPTAWKTCWGVPEFALSSWTSFFTGDFLSSHRPRPSSIQLSNLEIADLKIHEHQVACQDDGCVADLSLKHLKVIADIAISDLNSGEEFFEAHGIELRLRSGSDGEYPGVHLPFRFDSQAPLEELIQFDAADLELRIPPGSFAIGFAGDNEPIDYKFGGVFSSGDGDKYDHHRDKFETDQNFHWFLATANIVNGHLAHYTLFVSTIEDLIKKIVAAEVFPRVQEVIAKELHPRRITLPDVSLQHIIDGPTLDAIHKQVLELIAAYRKELLAQDRFDLRKQKSRLYKLLEHVQSMIKSHTVTSKPKRIDQLKEVATELRQACVQTLKFAGKCDESRRNRQRAEKINGKCAYWNQQLVKTQGLLEEQIEKAKNELSLGFAPSDHRFQGAPLSLVLATSEFKDLVPTGDSAMTLDDPDFDFSFQISVAYMNAVIQKFHSGKEFDFCVNYSGTHHTCANGSNDLRVDFEKSPVIKWEDTQRKLVFRADNIRSKVLLVPGSSLIPISTTEYPVVQVAFDLAPSPEGIFFNPSVHGDIKLRHRNIFRTLISTVKAMTLIHPLVAELMMGIKMERDLEKVAKQEFKLPTVSLSGGVCLPKLKVEKVITTPEYIKFLVTFDPPQT